MNGEGDYGDFDVRKTLERYLKARFPEREEFVLLQTEKLRLNVPEFHLSGVGKIPQFELLVRNCLDV